MAELTSVAAYRRRLGASLERVWENVRDWEHLPWLHRESFASIALLEEGDFGWRARIGVHGGDEIRLELVVDGNGADRYVSRTLEGPGAGTEIWTTVTPIDALHTDVEVEFLLPDVAPSNRQPVGDGFVALYTRLWDQDEAMMRRRSWLLETPRAVVPDTAELDLGPASELEARGPQRIQFAGRPVVVTKLEDEWIAFDALCPHWLGPLDEARIEEGRVSCPWHGYVFDLRNGRGCDAAAKMRLAPAPKLTLREGRLVLTR